MAERDFSQDLSMSWSIRLRMAPRGSLVVLAPRLHWEHVCAVSQGKSGGPPPTKLTAAPFGEAGGGHYRQSWRRPLHAAPVYPDGMAATPRVESRLDATAAP